MYMWSLYKILIWIDKIPYIKAKIFKLNYRYISIAAVSSLYIDFLLWAVFWWIILFYEKIHPHHLLLIWRMLLHEPYGTFVLWNALVLLSLHQLQGGFQMGVQILKKINHCVEGKEMEAEKIRTRWFFSHASRTRLIIEISIY